MSVAAAAALVTLQRFTSRFAIAGGSAPSSEVSGPGAGRSGKLAAHRTPNTTANTSANAPASASIAIDAGVKSAATSIPVIDIGRVCRNGSLRRGFWAEYDCGKRGAEPWGNHGPSHQVVLRLRLRRAHQRSHGHLGSRARVEEGARP